MQNREKYLAIGLGTALLLWTASGFVKEWVFGPFKTRSTRLTELTDRTHQLEDQMLLLARARKQMSDWKTASLPPDRGAATAKRPDALDAQRLYQAWLTNLAHLSGLESPSVKPANNRRYGSAGRGASAKPVYVGVVVTIETEGRFSQLCNFLDHFYQARLLQRINKLNVESRESLGDPVMKLSLEAEGLALVDVPWRATIFPETRLAAEINDKLATCVVETTTAFPKKLPFRVRIGNEYVRVSKVDGSTWTIERGVDRTFAAKHAEGAVVELAPVQPGSMARTAEEFRQVLAANVFIKPQPPKQYRLQIGPLAQQSFTRGQSLNFSIPVNEFDPTLGAPEFVAISELPDGLNVERGTGKVTWQPKPDQAVGVFPLQIEVRHPSAAGGKALAKVDVAFREPNDPPTATVPERQLVFLGRPWSLKLQFQDEETDARLLALRLDSQMEGLALNAREQQLEWTPSATITPGDYTINVTATDSGDPPQSKTLNIPVTVRDDDARFTYLVAAVSVDGAWQAWLYNRAMDVRTILRVGDKLAVADVNGTVKEIGKDFVVIRTEQGEQRLELGQNLRELTTVNLAANPGTHQSQ